MAEVAIEVISNILDETTQYWLQLNDSIDVWADELFDDFSIKIGFL